MTFVPGGGYPSSDTNAGPWTPSIGTAPAAYDPDPLTVDDAYPGGVMAVDGPYDALYADPAEPLPTWPRHDPATGFGLALIVGAVVVGCLVAWRWRRG